MPILKLKILADDIRTASYFDHHDCPIARAILREGFTYTEVGPAVARFSNKNGYNDMDIRDLNRQVIRMYDNFHEGEQVIDLEAEITY